MHGSMAGVFRAGRSRQTGPAVATAQRRFRGSNTHSIDVFKMRVQPTFGPGCRDQQRAEAVMHGEPQNFRSAFST